MHVLHMCTDAHYVYGYVLQTVGHYSFLCFCSEFRVYNILDAILILPFSHIPRQLNRSQPILIREFRMLLLPYSPYTTLGKFTLRKRISFE